ncbi:SGNH/GDSL hydrolase family protein [Gordonia sp. C13]|uniref:SGNH/GDSL hydrolase family protein n=1 Tax=Gordonia sp. C13 TaxID=2935078 RepID=UPI00200A6CDF|nr:SGNH/GDSL hydrolase family protein [Gordonia sp. C13]MCK8616204.1 SGNH/GDSL hydrolase family protein [Gordonia sp. C13]
MVLFYGDSLAAGSFSNSEGEAFPGRVSTALNAESTVVSQKGVRTYSFLSEHPRPPVKPDIAVVELGTNDVSVTPLNQFSENYLRLIRSLETESEHLVCVSVWINPSKAQSFNAAIEKLCGMVGGFFVDVTDLYKDSRNRGPAGDIVDGEVIDNFHPNSRGHRQIAQRIISVIYDNGIS